MELWLPYGKTEVCARVPTENFFGVIEPKEKSGSPNPQTDIEKALRKPIGTGRLSEMAKPDAKVAIVVDDATSLSPSYLMVPPILDELSSAGVKDRDVEVIFGCGARPAVEPAEMKGLLGEETLKRVHAISHDSKSRDQAYLGKTSLGTKVYVNRIFSEADVKILTGTIGLHSYAGYGGGREGVLPGVSSVRTIQKNHAMLLDSGARTGVLEGNPVHEDMVEAAKLAKVDFILNVVTNSKSEVVQAFAGDLEQAFREGVKIVDEMYKVPIERRAGIVVVSPGGDPFDRDLYQAYDGVNNALNLVKRGGVILLAAECPEGHGHEVFYDWMTRFKDVDEMERRLKRHFLFGGHKAYYLKRALKKIHIILVSVIPDYYAVSAFNVRTARAVNDALREAFNIAGKNAKVWVIPQGSITLPIIKTRG